MKAKHALIHDTFTLERRYPSAPAKVYRYFSKPEYRKRWFGSTEDWSQRSHSLDFRVGGQELEQGAPPGGPLITYDSRILDIVPGERIINSYVLAAAGERFSVSLSTVELLPDGTGTLMRVTEHGAYFDGNPEGPQMRVHGIGEQLELLGRVLQKTQTELLLQGSNMPKLVARCITLSLDGFSAAKGQALDAPFGKDGLRLMNWAFATRYFAKMTGQEGGAEGLDNDFLVHSDDNIGATIMGRNMFGPQRGPWPNEDWKGWWGPNPPYHHPVLVLSHHKHSSFEMEGGTRFSFVNDGIESALKQAFAAAKGKDVRIGGGASTVSQYLKAGLVDELHVVLVPMLLGSGERIFEGLDGLSDRYEVAEYIPSKTVAHVRIVKKAK